MTPNEFDTRRIAMKIQMIRANGSSGGYGLEYENLEDDFLETNEFKGRSINFWKVVRKELNEELVMRDILEYFCEILFY